MFINASILEKWGLSNYHYTQQCKSVDHSRCSKLDLLKKEDLQGVLQDIDGCFAQNARPCDARSERIEFLLEVLFRLTELSYSCAGERARVIIEKKLYNIAEGYPEEVVRVLDTAEYEKYERLKNVTAKLRFLTKGFFYNRKFFLETPGLKLWVPNFVGTRLSHHLRKRFGNVLVSNKVTTYVGGLLIILAGIGLQKPRNTGDKVSAEAIALGWVTILCGALFLSIPILSAFNAARQKNP